MDNIFKKMKRDKKEYREQKARIAKLPEDYRFVYKKIESYMWSFAGGSGMDMLKTHYELIDLFEEGATSGMHVLEVTGEDVASFCDALIQGNKLWTDNIRNRLNRKLDKRFSE